MIGGPRPQHHLLATRSPVDPAISGPSGPGGGDRLDGGRGVGGAPPPGAMAPSLVIPQPATLRGPASVGIRETLRPYLLDKAVVNRADQDIDTAD